jgi:hypothetical protein
MGYRTLLILTALSLLFFRGASGQDSLAIAMLVPDKAIKISPLHLLNFYPTIEVSYEQQLWPEITAQIEAGWVLPTDTYGDDEDFQNKRGVKLKLEGRYYYWGRTARRVLNYVSVEPYMNVINFDRQQTRTECFDVECNSMFTRTTLEKMEYREQGVSAKLGLLKYWSGKIFIDLTCGVTLRNIRYSDEPPEPVDAVDMEPNMLPDIPNEGDRVAILPLFSGRIGIRLK